MTDHQKIHWKVAANEYSNGKSITGIVDNAGLNTSTTTKYFMAVVGSQYITVSLRNLLCHPECLVVVVLRLTDKDAVAWKRHARLSSPYAMHSIIPFCSFYHFYVTRVASGGDRQSTGQRCLLVRRRFRSLKWRHKCVIEVDCLASMNGDGGVK